MHPSAATSTRRSVGPTEEEQEARRMAIHTCTRCDLRFEREAELRDHLTVDHRVDPDALRPHLRPSGVADRTLVVVVGNHTLLSDALRDRLLAVVSDGPTDVHVVVPVQHDSELDIGFWRGRALAERVAHPGVDFTVDVGVADPVALVSKAVPSTHVDRIILSVLPPGLSRWLQADVAGRLRHSMPGVAVEIVTAEG
jgi:hypothetical protein